MQFRNAQTVTKKKKKSCFRPKKVESAHKLTLYLTNILFCFIFCIYINLHPSTLSTSKSIFLFFRLFFIIEALLSFNLFIVFIYVILCFAMICLLGVKFYHLRSITAKLNEINISFTMNLSTSSYDVSASNSYFFTFLFYISIFFSSFFYIHF